ncbi:MAG: aspartate aminotransferase family protein [Gammaproteobacteria bacterium HGW-Gammaproteobacteria-14]|nr:MAG: aspartate aminotransferase family protein [Gammaproteobacteria bacterium HGW-Gammaproteobacteria-14]
MSDSQTVTTDQYLMPTYSRQPLMFSRGEGCWLIDEAGNRWLDGVAGIAVCNLGHCHPAVTEAITRQAASLVHTSNLYRIERQEALAEKLCYASGMEKVFFSNSGAEANEAAIKLARLHGHRRHIEVPHIIVMESAFHGRTLATLTATGNRKAQAGFEPLVQGFIRVPFNDLEAIRRVAASNRQIAAVLVEPIQGEGGIHVPATDYLAGLRSLCDEHDWLLMLDEIQTGNGRTGSYFAFQQMNCLPDVVTTAKGLGNGFPIGACLTRGKAAALFGPGSHGSTYGGNPLGCAAAEAVVDTLTGGVIEQVQASGDYLRDALRKQFADIPMISEIRGLGLMTGVQFDRDCPALVALCRDRGLLINVTAGSVVRLVPPLTISKQEIDLLVERLNDAVRSFVDEQEAA